MHNNPPVKKFYISSESDSISASCIVAGKYGISVASIDRIVTKTGDELEQVYWYVSRVNVKEGLRNDGIGSRLLQMIIEKIKSRPDKATIIVYPGGYNEDREGQFNFYKKNGFVCTDNPSELIYPI